ncbi:hypothetical protein DL766_005060 [Monosporascus sp. MC13-8B]|nr:hypothetical protein DL763_008967 [Monosporascus cannonballus]RYP30124.1 hypothetical protein DL766_005060 [Monosporascus sp. MC13-8B]
MPNFCKSTDTILPSILLLEARPACSGATGRNDGHLRPDTYSRPLALAVSHGVEAAADVAKFETDHLPAVGKAIEDEGIDCDLAVTRGTEAILMPDVYARMKDGIQPLKTNNPSALEDVLYAEEHEVEQKPAREAGANPQTHTPVSEVSEESDSKGYFTITTAVRGKVRAKKVVYATNAYTAALLPEFEARIVPGALKYDYLIPRTDGSIVVGVARSKYLGDGENWYDSVEDDKLIESARTYFDGYMQRNFRGWEDGGAYTSSVWTGMLRPVMGYSADGLPPRHAAGLSGREGGRSYGVAGRELREHRDP